MRKIELNGRGWRSGSRPLNYEPPVIDDVVVVTSFSKRTE